MIAAVKHLIAAVKLLSGALLVPGQKNLDVSLGGEVAATAAEVAAAVAAEVAGATGDEPKNMCSPAARSVTLQHFPAGVASQYSIAPLRLAPLVKRRIAAWPRWRSATLQHCPSGPTSLAALQFHLPGISGGK